jgi:hypothetical protein
MWRTTLPYFVNLVNHVVPVINVQFKSYTNKAVCTICFSYSVSKGGVCRRAVQTFPVALRHADCVHVAYRQVLLVSAGSLTWRRNWQWTPKGQRRLANTTDTQRKEGQAVVSREVLTSGAVADYFFFTARIRECYSGYTAVLLIHCRII